MPIKHIVTCGLGTVPGSVEFIVTRGFGGQDPGDLDVLDGATPIADGETTAIDFGTITVGDASPTVTFTVNNTGQDTITISGVNVPAGFTVTESLDASIIPGGSDTFTVKLNNDTAGTFSGDVEINSDDPDEDPYNWAVTGTVNSAGGSAYVPVWDRRTRRTVMPGTL